MDESPELPKKPSFQMERGLTFSVSLENAKRKREDDPGDLASEKKRKVSMEEPIKMPINLSISVQHPVKPGFGRSMTAPVGQIRSTSSESKQSEESEEGPELVRSITTKHGQTLQVRKGDITTENIECIVNAANSSLAHGAGVAGAVRRAGGSKLVRESYKWIKDHGEVPTGEVAWTSSGDMETISYVIHAVGPIFRDGEHGEYEELANAVRNSLELAHTKGWSGVAIPAISSGIFGFPKKDCAKVMFDVALEFLAIFGNDTPLKTIHFTNFDSPTVSIFCKEFDRRFKEKRKAETDEDKDTDENITILTEEERIEKDEGKEETGSLSG